jgi:putative hydrolase of the HAD superfamily
MTIVMFDYGGVISHQPSARDFALLAEAAGAEPAALTDAYWRWRRPYDLGELDADGYWRRVGRSLRRGYSDSEVAELARLDLSSWLRLQPGTVALVEELAAAGWPLAMLSNAPGDLATAVTGLPLTAHFGHMLFSCRLRSAKPDPECYGTALARMGARADEVIFVDDRRENLAAAATLGIRPVHFTNPESARPAIAKELDAHCRAAPPESSRKREA